MQIHATLVVFCFVASWSAFGQQFLFNNTNGSWNNTERWSGGILPSGATTASLDYFNNNGNSGAPPAPSITFLDRGFEIKSLELGSFTPPSNRDSINQLRANASGTTPRVLRILGDPNFTDKFIALNSGFDQPTFFLGGQSGSFGLLSLEIQGTRPIVVAAGKSLDVRTQISDYNGSAGIVKTGLGLLELGLRNLNQATGTQNVFTGGVRLEQGIVRVHVSSQGSFGALANGPLGTGVLTFAGGALRAGDHILGNEVAFGSSSSVLSFASNSVVTLLAPVNLGGIARPVQVGDSIGVPDSTTTLSGIISNGGITKTGTGTLTLSGTNTFTTPTPSRLCSIAPITSTANNPPPSTISPLSNLKSQISNSPPLSYSPALLFSCSPVSPPPPPNFNFALRVSHFEFIPSCLCNMRYL